jgi:hypothetical protein
MLLSTFMLSDIFKFIQIFSDAFLIYNGQT